MGKKTLCETCFSNVKPEELPTMYLPKAFCEHHVSGYPVKTDCLFYSKDGVHAEAGDDDADSE